MENSNRKTFMKYFIGFVLIFAMLFIFLGGTFSQDESLTFLMMGIDSKSFKDSSGVRSDTIMLFDLNKRTGDIRIISIPRDTKAKIEGRKNEEKINHSFAYGGPELTLDSVSRLIGKEIEYYVVVDYQVVKEYVDLIGGVDFNVPMDMKYSDPVADPPLIIDLKQGQQVLDGDKTLQYLRFRKGYKDADLGRINAQQIFLKEMISQSISFRNLFKIPGMLSIYSKNVTTNIPLSKLSQYGLTAFKIDMSKIRSETLPGSPKTISGVSYYIHSEDEMNELMKDIFGRD